MTRRIIKTGIFILALTSLAKISFGQFNAASGGRALGMAGSAIILEDEFGLFNNPGALSSDHLSLLLAFNTRYLNIGINDAQAGLVVPIGTFSTGLGVSYYGDELYNQLTVAAAARHQVGFARLGARLAYRQFYLENYGYKRTAIVDIGGVFTLSEEVKLAMLITNLTRSRLEGQEDYRLSSLLALGISYQPISSFRIDMQLTKDINLPVSGNLGMEYKINRYVSARTGFNFTNSQGALGLGLQIKQFRLDLAGSYQPRLGYGANFSLLISRKDVN